MKIIVTADLHGDLNLEIPECDLLLIAGDITTGIKNRGYEQSVWINGKFARWLDRQPAEHIVGIAGNHDAVFEQCPEEIKDGLKWTYLCDSGCEIMGLKIWGTPWSLPFCNWHFNAEESKIDRVLQEMPDDTDIIISHGPPYGHLDLAPGWRGNMPVNTGSKALLNHIERVNPLFTVCGHIHEGYGISHTGFFGPIINASYMDGNYNPVNPPIVIEYVNGEIKFEDSLVV